MRKSIVPISAALFVIACTVQASARGQVDDWNGTYAGLDLGYGWGSVKQFAGTPGGPLTHSTGSTNQDGVLLGGYAGYNWLLSQDWLLGVEGNMDWMDIGTKSGGTGATLPVNLRWEGSFRGRVGFLAAPSVLLYATGGYSFLDGSLKTLNSPVEVHPTTFDGWTVGAGAEWELDQTIVLRLQYRYSDYGTQRLPFPLHGNDIGAAPLVSTITAGISVRL
jgi:outer membrane immunogenic protein